MFELGLMIQCGLNVRAAWNRLTAEYEETQHKCKGYQRYLFEEMLVTRNQIEAGVNEAAASFFRYDSGSLTIAGRFQTSVS